MLSSLCSVLWVAVVAICALAEDTKLSSRVPLGHGFPGVVRDPSALVDSLDMHSHCLITLDANAPLDSINFLVGRYFIPTGLPNTYRVQCFDTALSYSKAYKSDRRQALLDSLDIIRSIYGVRSFMPETAL
ncbi:hypothetical protein KIPB_012964, partial [Kipferlia bialata]|eukprot:g12964.t1